MTLLIRFHFGLDAMINVVDGLKEGDSGSVFAFDGSKIES